MDLLRIATAGSVDDGKSTLIGRLLYDSKALDDDVVAAVEDASRRQRADHVNLALITDGLRAEREQGITIDVAYRYFATPTRKFVLADTPGHVQYTRNMVTGASNAEVALVMVDARNGLVEQSRRHAVLASLLGIDHIVVCVNKMDLVGFSQERFLTIRNEFSSLMARLGVHDITCIPVSALHGDNVVGRSARMPWYTGLALLPHLEQIPAHEGLDRLPLRLPVQHVIRPQREDLPDYRGYAGSIASGTLRVGDPITVLPSGRETIVAGIDTPRGAVQEASVPDAVTIRVEDDLDVARGEILCAPGGAPRVLRELDTVVCWMGESSQLRPGGTYRIKHATQTARARVASITARFGIESLSGEWDAEYLGLNEVGRVSLKLSAPMPCDDYTHNRVTGSFILIDEQTNNTVAAGMIGKPRFSFRDAPRAVGA